jgi:hypothetical protein
LTSGLLLSFDFGVTSLVLLFLRDAFTAIAASPPVEAAPATINPMVAKQTGHIASPLSRAAKRERYVASVWMTGIMGRFLQTARFLSGNLEKKGRRFQWLKRTNKAGLTILVDGSLRRAETSGGEARIS